MSRKAEKIDYKAYYKIVDQIERKVRARIGGRTPIIYSAYEEDDDCMPIDNTQEVAVKGRVRFIADADPYFGNNRPFRSRVYVNPTWATVAKVAHDSVRITGDMHHTYFEGVVSAGRNKTAADRRDGVKVYALRMGS